MKKVFQIGYSWFWASNGQKIRRLHYVDQALEEGNSRTNLKQFDRPWIQVKLVPPPPGRCPSCGDKVELTP